MTTSLIDHRPRGELVAELYDRHAAGLFAYCHDQLGDTTSAANALVAVLTNVPAVEPPRAALYAHARREVYRRDVAYVLPSVDPVADPAGALVERVTREIRPHQREVLLLSAVCGLDAVELAWVLDVAADTAEQLEMTALRRFTHSLTAAVSAAVSGRPLPPPAAEAISALGAATAEGALARLPWRSPPMSLRSRVLDSIPEDAAPVAPAQAPARRLWPTSPRWPLPLAEPNPVTNAGVFPAKEPAPPRSGRRSRHEATTEPMPKIARSAGARGGGPGGTKSLFGDALAGGQWPTLQRTFSVGRPPSGGEGRPAREPAPETETETETARTAAEPPVRPPAPGLLLAAPVGDVLEAPVAGVPPAPEPPPVPAAPPAPVTHAPARASAGAPPAETARPEPEASEGIPSQVSGRLARLFAPRRPPRRRPADRPEPDSAVTGPATAVPEAPSTATAVHESADPEATLPEGAVFGTAAPEATPSPAVEAVSAADAAPVTAPAAERAGTERAVTDVKVFGVATSAVESPSTDATATGPLPAVTSGPATGPLPAVTSGAAAPVRGAERASARPRRHDRPKPIKMGEHHFDWLWELVGFVICVAIALAVFFAVPTIVTP
ncbi:hypothetical protein [Sphaerisporangium sp. TRM90804]|uniref:hypothetical protein n=1 Tax=Sphaerisporangium sp. TRM90804 TaxID=3031113 RepID=UPI002449B250|nr:hypothetical protein [Sphaerisporangium sp. TRM90804]MDH2427695.1 hypothetical protein [Sphaerisporangium sp. TRM90804]